MTVLAAPADEKGMAVPTTGLGSLLSHIAQLLGAASIDVHAASTVSPFASLDRVEQLPLDLEAPVPPAMARELTPIVVANRIVSVIEVRRERPFTESDRALLAVAAAAASLAFSRQDDPSDAGQRPVRAGLDDMSATRFLADATVAIGLEPDLESGARRAANLLVPYFADWCAIDVTNLHDTLQPLAESHWVTSLMTRAEIAPVLQRVAVWRVPAVWQTRTADGVPVSVLAVPILWQDMLLGVLSAAVLQPRRRYSGEDLEFATAYALRIAAAIGHAWRAQVEDPRLNTTNALLATLSHELRTPASAVLGWIRLLQTGRLSAALAERALAAIQRSAETQARLVADMFDLSRILMGTYRLRVVPFDASVLVGEAVDAIRPEASTRQIDLVVDAAPGALMYGDALRLEQAVSNVLGNALKYTPPGGRITAGVQAGEEDVRITIRDSGRGIDAAFLPHVFQALERDLDEAVADPGIGLGLTLAKRIAELHGGTIAATSGGLGLGACFTLSLPLRPTGRRALPPAIEPGGDPDPTLLEGVQILVVTDDGDSRAHIHQVLQAYGASVIVSESASAALVHVAETPPDLVVSDLSQGERDALAHGLGLTSGVSVPAVAISGYSRGADHLRFLSAGFHLHLSRPVRADELARAVAALTRRRPSPSAAPEL